MLRRWRTLLGEFGDHPHRYLDAKARKAYAGTAPVTNASGSEGAFCTLSETGHVLTDVRIGL